VRLPVLAGFPEGSVPLILTDPPWPNCDICFCDDPAGTFAAFAFQAARISGRLIVVLGCDTDVRFLSTVPKSLPFFRLCWLRRIPGSYRGSLFYSADVAYVFGHQALNGTDRVIGGESTAVLQKDRDDDNPHPTRRHIEHMSWLVRKFSRPGDLVLDPFCGSGSTLVAAKRAGRPYCGIDKEKEYCDFAELRLSEATTFFDPPSVVPVRRGGSFNLNRSARYKR
jgi:hypothetical protein